MSYPHTEDVIAALERQGQASSAAAVLLRQYATLCGTLERGQEQQRQRADAAEAAFQAVRAEAEAHKERAGRAEEQAAALLAQAAPPPPPPLADPALADRVAALESLLARLQPKETP